MLGRIPAVGLAVLAAPAGSVGPAVPVFDLPVLAVVDRSVLRIATPIHPLSQR